MMREVGVLSFFFRFVRRRRRRRISWWRSSFFVSSVVISFSSRPGKKKKKKLKIDAFHLFFLLLLTQFPLLGPQFPPISCGPAATLARHPLSSVGHQCDVWRQRRERRSRKRAIEQSLRRLTIVHLDLFFFSSPLGPKTNCPRRRRRRPPPPTRTERQQQQTLFFLPPHRQHHHHHRQRRKRSTGPRSRRCSPRRPSAARSSATTSARRPARSSP